MQVCAKFNYHSVWCHPNFVGRGSNVIGLQTYGKDINNLLVRCIIYDLSSGNILKSQPIGIVIIPIGFLYPCRNEGFFGHKTIDKRNGMETIITCNKNICPKYEKCQDFMALYEKQKDDQISNLLSGELHDREKARLKIVIKLMENPVFQKCKTIDERMAIARPLVPFGTPEKIIMESIKLASSKNISLDDMKSIFNTGT